MSMISDLCPSNINYINLLLLRMIYEFTFSDENDYWLSKEKKKKKNLISQKKLKKKLIVIETLN